MPIAGRIVHVGIATLVSGLSREALFSVENRLLPTCFGGCRIGIQTKGVSFRIQQYSYGVLGLVLSNRRSEFHRLRYRDVEIIDGDVEMEHHLLFANLPGPDRSTKVVVPLKTDERRRAGYGYGCPILISLGYGPAKNLRIEDCEAMWVSGVKTHPPPLRSRASLHVRIIPLLT